MGPIRKHLPWYIVGGCGIGLCGVFLVGPPPERCNTIAEPRVLRIIPDDHCELLPVFQTSVNGTVTRPDVVRPKTGRIPTLRVDFYLDGQPVSLWVWDHPMPADP